MRIDGIHYEHELTVEELENIRGHLVENVQRLLGDIALVNAEIDNKVGHSLIQGDITAEQAFGIEA